jgi:succinate dehydrogenase / fumarate reductase cytochrome b subunit
MHFPTSTVGRKIVMALTGQVLIAFILFHISGNSTIFFHKLNAYVVGLHALPVIVWGGRAILVLAFGLHIWCGTVLKIENNSAKPDAYAITNLRNATFAGRYQSWTGLIIAAFLIYHLLQFTFRMTNPAISADTHIDTLGRPDVFTMVFQSFRNIGISGIYVIALAALGLHLLHGIQSSLQTEGLNNEQTLPVIVKAGTVASIILFVWYLAIPAAIVFGVLIQ